MDEQQDNSTKESEVYFEPGIYKFHKKMLSVFGKHYLLFFVLVIAVFGLGAFNLLSDLMIDLSRSRAGGPNVPILYGQNLAPGLTQAQLENTSTQRSLLEDIKEDYSKDHWSLNLLSDPDSDIPPFPPSRALLYFAQLAPTTNRGNVLVESGFVALEINEDGADDDVLVDAYVQEIIVGTATLTPDDAESRVVPPLDSEIVQTKLVYAFLPVSVAPLDQQDPPVVPPLDPDGGGSGAFLDAGYLSANLLTQIDEPPPTKEPTVEPTVEPTQEPTVGPTSEPTTEPTIEPSPAGEPESTPTPSPSPRFTPTPTSTLNPTPSVIVVTPLVSTSPIIVFPSPDASGSQRFDGGDGGDDGNGDGGEGGSPEGIFTPTPTVSGGPRLPCYFASCRSREDNEALKTLFTPQLVYKLAYRYIIQDTISNFIPSSARLKGLTQSGSAFCSADSDCLVNEHLCIENSCQVPRSIGQTCDSSAGNHDCSVKQSLTCNSVSSTCEVAQLLQSCNIDNDCNAPGKNNDLKVCGFDNLCHLKEEAVNALGTGNGLLGNYRCKNADGRYLPPISFDRIDPLDRVSPPIDFDWGLGDPVGCEFFPGDFQGTWTGFIEPLTSETYTIYWKTDGAGSLRWWDRLGNLTNTSNNAPGESSFTTQLRADQRYSISALMSDDDGPAEAVLSWSSPTIPKEPIPMSQAYTPDALPPLIYLHPQDRDVTEGHFAMFSAAADGTSLMTYQWQKDGRNILGATETSLTIEFANLDDAGEYTLVVRNSFGFDISKPATLTVSRIPGGTGTGLNGYYFRTTLLNEEDLVQRRLDAIVDFEWGESVPEPLDLPCFPCANGDEFSVRWNGEVYVPRAGEYFFAVRADDGARLWINDELILNNWYTPEEYNPDENGVISAGITLSVGKHKVRMDYWEGAGNASARLFWTGQVTGAKWQPIQTSFLFPLDFIWPSPTVENGDMVYVDALTGKILKIIHLAI